MHELIVFPSLLNRKKTSDILGAAICFLGMPIVLIMRLNIYIIYFPSEFFLAKFVWITNETIKNKHVLFIIFPFENVFWLAFFGHLLNFNMFFVSWIFFEINLRQIFKWARFIYNSSFLNFYCCCFLLPNCTFRCFWYTQMVFKLK